jgi:WhiB family redox-sensing transcriptional regulator
VVAELDDWRTFAACRGVDPDVFFPHPGESQAEPMHYCNGGAARTVWVSKGGRPVKLVLEQRDPCPVAAECLDYALARRLAHGIFGGKSERERRRILKGLRLVLD